MEIGWLHRSNYEIVQWSKSLAEFWTIDTAHILSVCPPYAYQPVTQHKQTPTCMSLVAISPGVGQLLVSPKSPTWETNEKKNSVTYLESEMLEQVVHEDRWRYPRSHLQWGYYSHIKEGKPKKIIFWRKSVDATRSNFHWFCIFLICFHQILKTHQRWSTTNSCVLFKFFLHGVQREKSKPNVSGVKSCAETSSSLFY